MTVRIGVLGLGQRGLQHLKALWQLRGEGLVDVVALGDAFAVNLDEAKLRQYVPDFEAGDIVHSTNFDELLAQDLDAVYINLPPNVHSDEVLRAAEAGVHLFVEKPMSLYLDEAIEMQRAIDEAGVISSVGFQQRFDHRHEAMQQFLDDKQVVMAQYVMHAPLEAHSVKHTLTEQSGGPSNRVWTANRAWSGGTVVEAGIHPLDLWRFWFGDVAWVQARYVHRPTEEIIDGADNPYTYSALFGFENGAVGTMTLSRLRRVFATQSDHAVLWHEGRLRLEGDDVAAYHYDGVYPPEVKPTAESVRRVLNLPPQRENTTVAIARAFVEAIRQGNPSLVRSSFGDAMNSLAAVVAANVSDELSGETVKIEELLTAERYAEFRAKIS